MNRHTTMQWTALSGLLIPLAMSPVVGQATEMAEQPAVAAVPEIAVAPAVTEVAAPAAAQGEVPASVASEVPGKPKDTLAVDFPDEDIRSILRNVADLFELNLVIPDTLQGRTSIKLRDVTWRQIFEVILSPIGYTFVEDGNIIKVVTTVSLAAEPATTEVFIINYAKAGDILGSINPLVEPGAGGRIVVDTRSNALVITERPSRLSRIRPIIDKLDKATDQVMIESKFIEVSDNQTKDLGLDWAVTAAAVGDIAGSAKGGNRAATPPGATQTQTSGGTTLAHSALTPFSQSTDYATSVLSSAQLAATLNFLQTKGNGKVVNNPTLVTLNNTEAVINVGTEYPIPSYTYNAEQGSFQVSGFEYKPIGVLLKVTPQINSQGFVRLSVEPEISSRNPANDVIFGSGGGGTASIPVIETRKAKTQVSLKDGHTLGIGGLIKDEKSKTESRLPFFSDIPGIGRLFRSDSTTNTRMNLLIFITAKVVSAQDATVEEVFDPRQVIDAKLKKSDLPGFRSSKPVFVDEESSDKVKK